MLLVGMAGMGWAEETHFGNSFNIPDNSVELFAETIHLDNCAKHGLEHSWRYYRIWKTGLVSCRFVDEFIATCKDDYGAKEINYPSGVAMDLPNGDLDEKIFRRVCKNCKISEDMRVIHKETWEKTE